MSAVTTESMSALVRSLREDDVIEITFADVPPIGEALLTFIGIILVDNQVALGVSSYGALMKVVRDERWESSRTFLATVTGAFDVEVFIARAIDTQLLTGVNQLA